jgi:hypothetical protein
MSRGAGISIIGGADIHIFVFCPINFFWNRLFLQSVNTNIWISAPAIIDIPAPLFMSYWIRRILPFAFLHFLYHPYMFSFQTNLYSIAEQPFSHIAKACAQRGQLYGPWVLYKCWKAHKSTYYGYSWSIWHIPIIGILTVRMCWISMAMLILSPRP